MSWGVPAAAASFWGGLLVWQAHPPWLAPWMALAVGGAALAGAVVAAPRRVEGPGALVAAGLIAGEAPAREAVASARVDARGGGAAVALAVVGILTLGVGWGGVASARLDASLMGRLVPRRVEAVGTLREDPAPGSMGWHGIVDVTRASWDGGAAAVRESVWLNGDGRVPRAVRGDEVSFEGVLRIPGDAEFAEALRHKGIPCEVQADRFTRLGPSANPLVHATQGFRTFVGRSIGRLFPPREAGLLMGLALGDASKLDPGVARDFQATGLGHLLVARVRGQFHGPGGCSVSARGHRRGLRGRDRAMGTVEVGFEITRAAKPGTGEPNERRGHVSIGVDIGKVADPTAIVVAEAFQSDPERMETSYEVRSIRRLKLGTPYPEVVSAIVSVLDRLERIRGADELPWLVIDGTGVGEPISDEIRGALRGRNVRITTAIFVAGERFKGRRTDARVSVGKDWMVARLQVLLENRRLKLPTTAMARELAKELQDFEVRTIDGHDVSGAFRTGTHDDLVVALGLACLDSGISIYESRGLMSV